MNKHKVQAMKKLLRSVALLSSAALLALGMGVPAQAASPSPAPSSSPSSVPSPNPSVTPSPKASPKVAASPTPLPSSAPKPGAKPKAAARIVTKSGAAAPLLTAPSASLPATNCTSPCSIWATDASLTVPGLLDPLPVWGFTTNDPAITPHDALIPGPTLIFNESDSIVVTLHNNLPSPAGVTLPASPTCPDDPRCISLELPALQALPDTTGVAFGSSKSYAIGHLAPGTYLYQAGPTPHGLRQLRMGLAGVLIVRPHGYVAATTQGAYDGPGLGLTLDGLFTAEAVAALNEFDPEFNRNPFGFDPVDYNASVFMLNGHAFDPLAPGTGKIDVGNTDVLLMRYANLGTHDRGLTILDHRQQVLADDSNRLTNPGDVATKWLTAGQVSDAFIKIDPQEQLGSRISIFESGYHLNNGGSLGLGGAMSYLDVVSGVAGVASGPLTSVNIATYTNGFPANHSGTQNLTFTATINATTAPLTDGEWFLDGVGAAGTGYKFSDATHASCSPAVGGATTTVTCVISATQLNSLLALAPPADGDHIIWAHGMDGGGWGVVSGDVFTFNGTGPVIGSVTSHAAVSCTPDPSAPPCAATNGYSAMTIRANVAPVTGSSTGFPVFTNVANGASNTHLVNGQRVTCTAADVAAVPSVGCTALGEDVPNADLVLLGTAAASLSDWVVLGGEYCLDPVGNNVANCPAAGGTTTDMKLVTTPGPSTGNPATYSGPLAPDACVPGPSPAGVGAPQVAAAPGGAAIVSFCGRVPQAILNGLADGTHNLYLHAYEAPSTPDASSNPQPGRWGAYSATPVSFVIDRTGPNGGAPVIDHNPNNGTVFSAGNLNFLDSLQVTTTLDDGKAGYGSSTVTSGEVFVTANDSRTTPVPAAQYGTGAEMVPNGGQWDSATKVAYAYIPLAELTAYPEGLVKFWVHARDIAGNWGEWSSVLLTLDRTAPKITSSIPASGATTALACTGAPAGCSVSFSATDPASPGGASNIVQAEWFAGFPDPGVGLGIPITNLSAANPTVTGAFQPVAASGSQIFFRVKDAAGNWSATTMVVAK
jgi:FtsP/CotA-like multicopper oxidase with cupredoxin domain